MSRFLVAGLVVLSGYVTVALADAPKDLGRDVIVLKMGVMELRFQHWKHQARTKGDCFSCHKTRIGVIDGWGKDTAHKICIPCHDLENKGPVQCHECHGPKTTS
jgi:predicted CXXCH cytochrome family protein